MSRVDEYYVLFLRFCFIVSFGVTTFLEIFFGIPGFVFIIIPFLTFGVLEGDGMLFLATLYLSFIFIFAMCGLISFVLNLINNKNLMMERYTHQSEYWYKFKTYDNFNSLLIFLLGFGAILHAFSHFDPYQAVARKIYSVQLEGYQEFNPHCPDQNNASRSANDIFLDELHERYSCCGWNGPEDWMNKMIPHTRIPFSCCVPDLGQSCSSDSFCSVNDNKHYKRGCRSPMKDTFNKYDPSSYATGVFYFLLKAVAYLTYCGVMKETVEGPPDTRQKNFISPTRI